jgi:ubiquinone biosynthesis monooxygenase Coq7
MEKHINTASPEVAEMLRVNLAGEYGAKRIYAGQLAALKGTPSYKLVHEMQTQELKHLQYFEKACVERAVRPTVLHPIWHVGGWMLGAITAKMGEKAAMACTVAVESVITEHYQQQLDALHDMPEEAKLSEQIATFQAEEMEHHDTGLAHGASQLPAYGALYHGVRGITKLAIALSKRV